MSGTAAAGGAVLAVGVPASPGRATGSLQRTLSGALDALDRGDAVVFVTERTSPSDEAALRGAAAVVTTSGGLASHAAIVARAWGIPAVCGAEGLVLLADGVRGRDGHEVHEGEPVTVDGSTGEVWAGSVPTEAAAPHADTDGAPPAPSAGGPPVLANADTAAEAASARTAGAAGIGLCRVEHLLAALGAPAADLAAVLRAELTGVLAAMDGLPVTVRLLDEASPGDDPHLGRRGARSAVIAPDVAAAQGRAVAEAVAARRAEGGDPQARLLVPFVMSAAELAAVAATVRAAVAEVLGDPAAVPVGAMIETPRAALVAGALAEHADHLAVGTNDLTQLVFGLSRDDAGALAARYVAEGLLSADPFAHLDGEGVGWLVAEAVRRARAVRPDIAVTACGEHAGDPASIQQLLDAGVDALSCAVPRLAIARRAVAGGAVTGRWYGHQRR